MRAPDFLIVGAGKAGTTSLHQYVSAHPQVFMPPKGVHYFAYDGGEIQLGAPAPVQIPARTWTEYLELFAAAGDARAAGESSATYLASPHAAERIRDALPDARIVVMLRHPVRRAYSDYQMWVRNRGERRVPQEAFGPDAPFVKGSFYYKNLGRFFDRFPCDQIFVGLFDDLRADSVGLTRRIYRFIGVDGDHTPDTSKRSNQGGLPRSQLVHQLTTSAVSRRITRALLPASVLTDNRLGGLKNLNRTQAPALPPDIERWLIEAYRADVAATGELIGRDLSMWLEGE